MLAATAADTTNFVDLDVPAYAWVGLIAVIIAMLVIDLIRHREAHAPTPREAPSSRASGWPAVWRSAWWSGSRSGAPRSASTSRGYLIEKSLSVDNVFVWSMLFTTFAIPLKYQHRVLFWGIFGALTLRAIFIFLGVELISRFWWLLVVFGVFLVYTGFKVIRHRADEQTHQSTPGLGLLRRIMPVTDTFDGQHFLTRIDGKRAATPLLAALVVIEVTDVIFAVDSVPAILAVSNEMFLVFASNAFAILGLRAMYFLLANAKERFHYLSHALGGILIFVGLKMTVAHWFHLNTYVSLGVIVAMLIAAVVFSIRKANQLGLDSPADLTHDHDH